MKKKKVITIIIIVLIIISLVSSILILLNNLSKDANKTKELIQEIKSNNQTFEENIVEYNNNRINLSNIIKDTYLEDLKSNYQNIFNELTNTENNLKETEKITNQITKLCKDKSFQETEVNNICTTTKTNYDKLVSVYKDDINKVNNIIKNYNAINNDKLEEYTSSYLK